MSATKNTTSQRWYREDLVLLLSYLNFHTYKIQQEILEEERHGMGYATEILSDCLAKGCSPARVARKLHSIWHKKGAEGSKLVDLYYHGAWLRTLPLLDPKILQEVAATVKSMQESSLGNKNEAMALIESDNIRRSKRRALKDIDSHPIQCRCTFSHFGSTCIHCDGCPTWQHIFCYYGDDTKKPTDHLCDQCTGVGIAMTWDGKSAFLPAQEDLVKSMKKLDIHSDDIGNRMTRRITAYVEEDEHMKGRTGSFDLPRDDEEPWGLEDSEISGVFQLITYQIKRLADSIPASHFSTCRLSSKFLAAKEELKELLKIMFGDDIEKSFKSIFKKKLDFKTLSTSFFGGLISAAVQQWVFYSPTSDVLSFKTVSFDIQQKVILAKYGMRTLRNIRRATCASLIYENPELIKPIITKEAEQLTRRLLETIEPLVIPTNSSKDIPEIEEWTTSTQDGKSRYLVVLQIFTASLKFKARLPLTEQYYEIFSPILGSLFSRDLMAAEGEDVIDMDIADGSTSKFCVMPGLIEYPISAVPKNKKEVDELFGPHNFIKLNAEEQGTGRVICPAIVTL